MITPGVQNLTPSDLQVRGTSKTATNYLNNSAVRTKTLLLGHESQIVCHS